MTTTHRDPQSLRPHRLRLAMTRPDPDSPRVHALVDSIREHGFDPAHPLLITDGGDVLVGVDRLYAARRLQLTAVPCLVTSAPPEVAILRDLSRRHYSAGARAYLAVPLIEAATIAGIRRRSENLKKGQQSPETVLGTVSGNPRQILLQSLGITEATMQKAQAVRRAFDSDKKLPWETPEGTVHQTAREWFEPKLLGDFEGDEHEGRRPIGLGGILKALGGKPAQRKAPEVEQLDLFRDGARSIFVRALSLPETKLARQLQDAVDLVIAHADDQDEAIDRLITIGRETISAAEAARERARAQA